MKNIIILVIGLIVSVCVKANNVYLSNDTLFCNLTSSEAGTLKTSVESISDLNTIKTIVLTGYIAQADEDFIHMLGKNYSLTNLDMTELRSSMSYQGLEGCTKLKTVKYSKYWTSTGQYLFQNCSNLSEIIFPKDSECSLTNFSSGTFRGCSSLKEISIPATIKSLDPQVFYLCSNLKTIYCKTGIPSWSTTETFGSQFFSATIYVPIGSVDNYKTAAGWCNFSKIIENPNYSYTPNSVFSDNVSISNDTLYCDMTKDEVGRLRATVLNLTKDVASVKYAVLSGYLNSDDGSFLNALACSYSLSLLDLTNLHSQFSDYQFYGCTKLKGVKYSRYWTNTGRYLFDACSNLTNITFPENHSLGGYTLFDTGSFRECSTLQKIEIPRTVSNVKSQCFYLCDKLTEITLKSTTPPNANKESFGNQFSSAKLIVPKGSKKLYSASAGWSLFSNIVESSEDVNIEDKDLSENISFLNDTIFITLPSAEMGRLKATVLSKVENLSSIKVAVISNYLNVDDANFLNALASSYNLGTIDFTDLKSSFGDYAFEGCTKLQNVKYSKYWSNSGWYLFKDCSSLSQVEFPKDAESSGITSLSTGTFRGCSSLQKIEIPQNVVSIGSQCFSGCHNLKEITFLGTSINSIDKGAFEGCTSLETIILPTSISLVGERCFEGCPKIKEVYCQAQTPPDASESSFDDIYETAKLYVPNGCQAKYASAPVWKNFTSIEEGKPTGINNIKNQLAPNNCVVFTLDGKVVRRGVSIIEDMEFPTGTYVIKTQNTTKKIMIK